ncbi:MAG TPA: undecaprenyl-diphosphate phosphatase [Armatimonadota bacterium]
MSILQAIVLGIIQGLTEFLPISSTAHLVIVPWFLHWPDPSKAFDIALHIGTLLALLIYFWKDLVEVLRAKDKRMVWLIVAGCVPLPLAQIAEKKAGAFSDPHVTPWAPLLIAGCLIGFAVLLKISDTVGRKKREAEKMSIADAIFVGVGQVIAAVFPGASRSGTTMTFALFTGLTREAAVRFSFLLSVPTIAAVALYSTVKHHHELASAPGGVTPLLAGIVASAIVGYLAIAFLMDYVKRKSMDVFFWYRIVAGLAIIAAWYAYRA